MLWSKQSHQGLHLFLEERNILGGRALLTNASLDRESGGKRTNVLELDKLKLHISIEASEVVHTIESLHEKLSLSSLKSIRERNSLVLSLVHGLVVDGVVLESVHQRLIVIDTREVVGSVTTGVSGDGTSALGIKLTESAEELLSGSAVVRVVKRALNSDGVVNDFDGTSVSLELEELLHDDPGVTSELLAVGVEVLEPKLTEVIGNDVDIHFLEGTLKSLRGLTRVHLVIEELGEVLGDGHVDEDNAVKIEDGVLTIEGEHGLEVGGAAERVAVLNDLVSRSALDGGSDDGDDVRDEILVSPFRQRTCRNTSYR